MLVVVLLLGILLFAAVGATRSVRASLQQTAAVQLLATLDRAMTQYQRDHAEFPPAADDFSSEPALSALINHPASRQILTHVPGGAWVHRTPPRVNDPWGTPLRYLGPPRAAARVAAHDGRPVFLSAGPDRSFGDQAPAGLGDNLATDDPGVAPRAAESQPAT